MNKLTTEIKSLHEDTLNNLKYSKALNTLRAYKSDFKDFGGFCQKHGFRSMPSEPKVVALYLTHLSKKYKISTLRRRLVAISMVHKIKGHYLDTKHPVIVENLLGIKRIKGTIQMGKKPLLINHLKQIIKVIHEQNINEIIKLRDISLVLTGFGGGFRRSELISIDYEDLEFVTEGLKITVKKSKTDQFGEGMIKGLPYFENENYCPVKYIKKWLLKSNIKEGPVFRRFTKGSKLSQNRLSDQTVVLLIKKYLKLAGIENTNYSGHSLRSGFATVAADSGADERSIMAMTGHKTSQMVRRYIREANIFKNNALSKIRI
tara:strand:- start:4931 stop:5884 length:954 start_codon:yes stop_codon:yes gene_type:complete